MCGGSSGAAMHACLLAAKNLGRGKRVVVILPDSTRNCERATDRTRPHAPHTHTHTHTHTHARIGSTRSLLLLSPPLPSLVLRQPKHDSPRCHPYPRPYPHRLPAQT